MIETLGVGRSRSGESDLHEKFGVFSERWSPKVAGEANDQLVKVAGDREESACHDHTEEDELSLVVERVLTIHLAVSRKRSTVWSRQTRCRSCWSGLSG